MIAVILMVVLLLYLVNDRKKAGMPAKYKLKYETDSATLIKYDKRSVKVYRTLLLITVVYFLLSLFCMFTDILSIQNAKLEEVLITVVLYGLYFGVIGTLYLGYQFINAVCYLKRLEKYGFEVPENRKEYEIVERLPKKENVVPIQTQGDHKGSKILTELSILVAIIMLILTGYYFYKWSFIGENAQAMLVVQLIADVFWLIPIFIFKKEMNQQKYKDDVEIDITRRTRKNVVSGVLLIIFLVLVALYVKATAFSMTKYIYVSRMETDRHRLYEIHDVLEIASCEMDLIFKDDPNWAATVESMKEGVDITTWGIPEGYFQEQVAGVLGITDFGSLKEEFSSAKKPAVVYVKMENNDIIVELQNLYPVADREVIAK